MTVTDEQRAAWQALADAATPGPWETYMDPGGPREAPFVAVEVGDTEVRIARFEGGHFDGAFIAASREAVPALLAALRETEAELAAIRAREEEVGTDEGWHIGGAWGDYGEVVVPLRILSYVVGGELDEKIVSTDPGYAATYAEQVARAETAEAEKDAWREKALTHAEQSAEKGHALHDAEVARSIAAVTPCSCSAQRSRAEQAEAERDALARQIEAVRALCDEPPTEGDMDPVSADHEAGYQIALQAVARALDGEDA